MYYRLQTILILFYPIILVSNGENTNICANASNLIPMLGGLDKGLRSRLRSFSKILDENSTNKVQDCFEATREIGNYFSVIEADRQIDLILRKRIVLKIRKIIDGYKKTKNIVQNLASTYKSKRSKIQDASKKLLHTIRDTFGLPDDSKIVINSTYFINNIVNSYVKLKQTVKDLLIQDLDIHERLRKVSYLAKVAGECACSGSSPTLEDLKTALTPQKCVKDDLMASAINRTMGSQMDNLMETYNASVAERCNNLPQDCHDLHNKNVRNSGAYTVFPRTCFKGYQSVKVFCEAMETDSPWMLLMRHRFEGLTAKSAGFIQGFGSVYRDHWIGMKPMSHITLQGNYMAKIVTKDIEDGLTYADYPRFRIGMQDSNSYHILDSVHTGNLYAPNNFWTEKQDVTNAETCSSDGTCNWWFKRTPKMRCYEMPDDINTLDNEINLSEHAILEESPRHIKGITMKLKRIY